MRIRLVSPGELGPELQTVWAEILGSHAELGSAFFRPEFIQSVARVRDNVEIAIIEENHKILGFFPFERNTPNLGGPVGGILSDYHGFVGDAGDSLDLREILRACNLIAWDFTHVPKSQPAFIAHHQYEIVSPCLDLAEGYAAYVSRQKASGSDAIRQTERRERRLVREFGELRFVADDRSHAAFRQVLAWKSAQYRKTGNSDLFAGSDAGKILTAIFSTQTNSFRGILSTLYLGDKLLAGHFGMLSGRHWHYWFPSYNEAYQRFSPGLILLLKMAEYAPTIGVDLIDLGGGTARYKDSLMNASVPLLAGSVERLSWLSVRRSLGRRSATMIKSSPLAGPARKIAQSLRAMSGSTRRPH